MRGTTRSGVARPVARVGLGTAPCAVAGSSMSFYDAASVTNGSLSRTVTRLDHSSTAFDAGVTLASPVQKAIDGSHRLTPNGDLRMGYRALSETAEQVTLSANGPVTAVMHTPCPSTTR